jgi:signal transduction histidine kinase
VFPVDLAVSEIDHMGQFTGIVRDISERKDLQRDILAIADEEQRRIGQDLHDSVQQELAAVGLLAQTLVNAIDRSPTVATSELMDLCRTLSKKIQSGLDRAHQEVRNISRGLVALPAEPTSLMDALCALANRTDGIRGVNCSFKCEAPVLIEDRMVATHLYRIAQEAVTNSLKHSEAKHVLLELLSDAESFELKIADDGKGFHYDIKAGGLGIKTMRYRAGLIGGTLFIMPIREGGTLVFCRFSKAGVNS